MKSKSVSNPDTYPLLLKRVRETLIEGQRRIEAERVRTYWETGRIIHEDILKHKDRAEYGKDVMERLEKDLEVDVSTLQRCVQFAKTYPRLPNSARGRNFSWSHYRHLITIPDDKERLRLEKSVIGKGWTAEELAARIKEEKVPADNTNHPILQLKFTRGKLHAYQIIKAKKPLAGKSPLVLDLGFRQEYVIPQGAAQFKEGDFVQLLRHSEAEGRRISSNKSLDEILRFAQNDWGEFISAKKVAISKDEIFTYKAYVDKIIDGDTLLVSFDFNLDVSISQKLRLRGIDCPEMNTEEGKRAKRFVESRLKLCEFIIVKTYKDRSDKFDRYLADVFYDAGVRDPSIVAREGKFLNQELLDERLAVKYEL